MRALHFVIKVADRTASVAFLHNVLGMHALRHEEFQEGCKAACNGPYDGMWSKTMMGYAAEDTSFVLELAYNYGVSFYKHGNDFGFLKVRNRVAYASLEEQGLGQEVEFNVREVASPDGHTFRVLNEDPTDVGCLSSLCLAVTDIDKSIAFWADVLGMLEIDKGDDFVVLSSGVDQATLRLVQLPAGTPVDHGTGGGRVAYSFPAADLKPLQVLARGYTVLTPLVSLDTPGKATVQVVILADPDGHEVCFVGDEAFRELSRVDDNAPQLLTQAIAKDTSREWRAGKLKREQAAAAAAPAAAPAGKAAAPAAAPAVPRAAEKPAPVAAATKTAAPAAGASK
ncbi:hypothetical protein CHLNCDRAFT_20875 [Chlorella variabilis]|uniref:VOC domain-containing protein n=1 Tax=Chlorella variabilis TaxID=554065 RepID=E1Z9L7_CHLVA|nr:hypothetical protein CHLNCDRAFT_20875 [Chlorella variabilis]EFN57800.1 hypothetical protein CHLNCDRAFT_20875 [Chlorella variabilis]|eukprot:XP_005849902.1 hypothetical protein CHLNCDRAFT_20875 [Chlorella variabilis]